MIEINKCKLVPGITASWGDITGNIENQEDLVEYISTHGGGGGGATWGSISGNIKDQTDLYNYFEDTYAWVVRQNYLKPSALNGYATESWVSSQNYLTSTALTGYATESWVSSQNYLTSTALTGYATESWVSSQNYLTSSALTGYATESWVSGQGYLVSSDLSQYATRQWVTGRGYITSEDLSGYATESWVSNEIVVATSDCVKWTEFDDEKAIDGDNLFILGYDHDDSVQRYTYIEGGELFWKYAEDGEREYAGAYYQQWPGYNPVENRSLSVDPYVEDKPEDYPIDEFIDWDPLIIGNCDIDNTWSFNGVKLGTEGAGIYTITPVEDGSEITYEEEFKAFALDEDLSALTSRVSTLETNYGDAVTTTNNILGV